MDIVDSEDEACRHEGQWVNPKNVLLIDGKHGPGYLGIDRLALCLELEALGCTPSLILEDTRVENNYVYSQGYRCQVSQLKGVMTDEKYECLLGLIEKRKQNPNGKSFQVVEEDGETYMVFPDVKKNAKLLQGAFLTKTDAKLQMKLMSVQPKMWFHNANAIIDQSISKISCDRLLKEAGVAVPPTTRLPFTHGSPYTPERIQLRIAQDNVHPPYIVKSEFGFGATGVFKVDTPEEICTLVNQIMDEHKQGVVVQELIPSPPEVGNRSQHIRVVVYDDQILIAEKNTGAENTFPNAFTPKIPGAPPVNVNFYVEREICTESLTPEQEALAIAAGRALSIRMAGNPAYKYICGVDMSTTHPPVVFEINDSPGLDYYIVKGTDIAAKVARILNGNMEMLIEADKRWIDSITRGGPLSDEIIKRRADTEGHIGRSADYGTLLRDIDHGKAIEIARKIQSNDPYSKKALYPRVEWER